MEKISSRSNEKIKFAMNLCNSAKARRETNLFLLEGARLCEDAAINSIKIEKLFVTAAALEKYGKRLESIIFAANESYEITEEISGRLTDTAAPQGIFCICTATQKASDICSLKEDGRYIALENIQDPANLGAVGRAAEALGIDGVIVSGGCDIYNPKAQRAGMGALLRIPVVQTENLSSLLIFAKQKGMLTLASTPESEAMSIAKIKLFGGAICVVGNEGNGITDEVMKACNQKVTIPMRGRVQSMNAATAAAILMWELVK